MTGISSKPLLPVLRVQSLSFSFPSRHVFTGWSADFGRGLTWLRGSNGSGKSTLLKLLAGALPPLTGTLEVQGTDAATQPLAYRQRVFWCGPGAIAFDHLRAPEYFAFLRSLYPSFDTTALAAHVAGLGLQPFLAPRLADLSTGTQRKVWLAAALSVGTPVVLLDEPLNALDKTSLAYLLLQLERVAAGAADAGAAAQAWIIASHDSLSNPQLATATEVQLTAPA